LGLGLGLGLGSGTSVPKRRPTRTARPRVREPHVSVDVCTPRPGYERLRRRSARRRQGTQCWDVSVHVRQAEQTATRRARGREQAREFLLTSHACSQERRCVHMLAAFSNYSIMWTGCHHRRTGLSHLHTHVHYLHGGKYHILLHKATYLNMKRKHDRKTFKNRVIENVYG